MSEDGHIPERQVGLGARLMMLALAIGVGLGLCEGAARLVYPAPPDPAREPQLLFEAHPNAGFLHVPNQAGYLDDGRATINAIGLRGDLPELPKPHGATRILAIGDSTTFGWGVGDDETYCAQLERMLKQDFPKRRLDVVNGGVAAYDLKHEVGLLRQLAPILKPDIVLVGLFWNDLLFEGVASGDVARDVSSATASPPLPANRTSKPFRLGNEPSRHSRWLRASRLVFGLRHAWRSAIAPTEAATNAVRWEMAILEGRQSAAIDAAWGDAETTLREIRSIGEAGGFPAGVVIMPIRAQVEHPYPHAVYQTRVKGMAESLGLFVIDPLPGFTEHAGEDLFIPYDRAHFTARGNALVADAVVEALRARLELLESHTDSTARR